MAPLSCLLQPSLKCIICVILATVGIAGTTLAQQVDTLTSCRPETGYVFFRNPHIRLQAARFVNPAPGFARQVILSLGGPSQSGAARLRIFGHEGGAPAPILEEDLIEPMMIHKSNAGFQRITVTLPERIFLENNQFFVALDHLDSGVVWLSDRVEKQPFCLSDDDRFSFQVLQLDDQTWNWENFSFAADVVMDYPHISPATPFGDVAPGLGILDSVHDNRSISWGDVNDDGYLDLLWDGHLYLNREGERFQQVDAARGLTGSPAANLFLDADNDGNLDILFLGSHDTAHPGSRLFLGDGGDHFTPVDLDLPPLQNPTSFSLADVDGDGYLDLFIGQAKAPADSSGLGNHLWLNRAGHGFVDASERLAPALRDSASMAAGSQFVDLDHDGDPDLYVACAYPQQSLLLYNDGAGTFAGQTPLGGAHQLGAGVGGDWKDYDNDGDFDLLYPRLIHSYLHKYRALQGSGIYTGDDLSDQGLARLTAGGNADMVAYEERHAGGSWGDVNNDGLLDAFFATAGECRFAELYLQQADHTFRSGTFEYGLHWSSAGKDGVWVDYDNDGWLDLCAIEWNRLRIYRNPGDGGHSGFVEIDAVAPNATAAGTSVTLCLGSERITREVTLGRGLLMGDPPRLHYGLGQAGSVDSAVVVWGDGSREVFSNIAANRITRLVKGSSGRESISTEARISAVPNPFSTALHIYYWVPRTGGIRLEIYNERGDVVKVLVDAEVSSGEHSVVWEGVDGAGDPVPGGVYLYRLVTPGGEVSGRAVLTR